MFTTPIVFFLRRKRSQFPSLSQFSTKFPDTVEHFYGGAVLIFSQICIIYFFRNCNEFCVYLNFSEGLLSLVIFIYSVSLTSICFSLHEDLILSSQSPIICTLYERNFQFGACISTLSRGNRAFGILSHGNHAFGISERSESIP